MKQAAKSASRALIEQLYTAAASIATVSADRAPGRGRPDQVGKGGVVRHPAVRDQVVAEIRAWLAEDMGWAVLGVTESPITGPAGNTEYRVAAEKRGAQPESGK